MPMPGSIPVSMMSMSMGNSTMDMGMEMVMTFGKWSDYQLKIVFNGWDVQEKWQFALSWLEKRAPYMLSCNIYLYYLGLQ